jgi:hypothetical protein
MTQQQQPGTSARPGQMTAVMRALAGNAGPKLLRIGVVQRGRIVEERIVKERTHVTIGASEKNLFVLPAASCHWACPAPNLPPTFRVFELVAGEYHLNFLDGMTGRLASATGISDLNVLQAQARRNAQGAYQVRLTPDARGKLVIGDTTLLFQFVPALPIQPRPQLPVAVLRGNSSIDWSTTIIAAVSFLVHFMVLGAVYSDWLDPVSDDDVSVSGLLDSLKNLPAAPRVEDKLDVKDDDTAKPNQPVNMPKLAAAGASAKTPGTPKPMNEHAVAALSHEIDEINMAVLGVAASGPATANVLKNGDLPTAALDNAAASAAAVGGGSEFQLRASGGAIRPGATGVGLTGVGNAKLGAQGPGTVVSVAGPKVSASVGPLGGTGNVSDAARVVANLRAGFRGCYQRGLADNPDAAGSIRLTIRVGAGGEVAGVSPASSGTLPASVVACVVARAKGAQFEAPQGGSAVVVVPVTFVKQ